MDVEVVGAIASATRNLRFTGRLTPPSASHPGSVDRIQLTLEGVPLDQVLPAHPSEPRLLGRLTATLQGEAATLDPTAWAKAVSGSGRVQLADATIENLNILRAVFEKLSMLPGLVERLQARLPESYQAKFAANDTVLAPIDLSMRLEEGALRFDEVQLGTETFQLIGTGRIGLDGTTDIRSTLRLDRELSAAVISSVNELQALANRTGELEIPVSIQGPMSRLAVLPDLNYVASRVVVTKAVDLLGEFLKKEGGADGAQTAGEEGGAGTSGRDLLGQFLHRALQRENTVGTQAQP